MFNSCIQSIPSLRLESKIKTSSKLFRQQLPFQNSHQQNKQQQKSIQQFLQSQNDTKIHTFKQSLNMLPDIQTIQFQDNSKYYGQIINDGIRHGIGIFETQEGDMYLGDWQNDTYHGYGMYIYHEGERYEGELVQGGKQGEGKYFYKDGRVYEGMWVGDQREGEGIERDVVKGVYYQGKWVNDQKHGRGKLCLLNPIDWGFHPQQVSLMQGTWHNDKFSSGIIQTEHYKGQFHNQTLTGQGVYKFSDGSLYQGQFMNNLMHGQGTYYYPNGDIYQGEFYCGLKHGKGVYKYFTGDVYTGSYEKDIKYGEGRFAFVNGNYYVGEFQRDCFHGRGKYFFTRDEAICGWWENGKIVKNQTGEDIGTNRKLALMRQNLQNGSRTPKNQPSRSPINNNNRTRSPINNHAHSTPNIQHPRNVSPFSLQRNIQTKQQKASMMPINPSRSPIKNSKFMEVHTPRNSYFKSPNVQYPLSSTQRKPQSSIKMIPEEKIIGQKKNMSLVKTQQINYQDMQARRSDQKHRQSQGKQRQSDRNLFDMMTDGQRELQKISRSAKIQHQTEDKNAQYQNSSQQVKKVSKKFQR